VAKDYKNAAKPKEKTAKAAPGWLWMLAGLSIGLFVALLVYLKDYQAGDVPPSTPAPVVEKSRPAEPVKKAEKPAAEKEAAQRPRFDFYNLLPEMEVLIPEQEIAAEREREAADAVVYYLQVASFKHFEEADRMRAQLALLNIESHIQRVSVNDEQTWHRVRVGPFTSAREMDKIRGRLQAESLEPMVLKTKVAEPQ
jgi:cell division protein FtsN